MENINIWKLNEYHYMDEMIKEINNNLNNNLNDQFCLLDMNKSKYSVLEKYVYDIAMFHFKRLNKDVNSDYDIKNNHFVEFWVKYKYRTSTLHVDCDEYLKKTQGEYKYPLLSCITYLNDSNVPTVITNIDLDRFTTKNIEKDLSLFFSFPKKGKQITFDGKYFHGSALLCEKSIESNINKDRYVIAINLWDKKPIELKYYNNSCEKDDDLIINKEQFIYLESEEHTENRNILNIGLSKDIMNYKLFENILYNSTGRVFNIFDNILNYKKSDLQTQCHIHNYKVFLDETIQVKNLESQLKTTLDNILEDVKECLDDSMAIKYNNRFLQRFIYPKIYCPSVCKWIINECETYAEKNEGWTKKRHDNYPTTDLQVKSISSIYNFVLGSLQIISEKIKKSYCLNNETVIDFKDLFIVKYKHDEQNFLEMHKDTSIVSFNILLSDPNNDFEGGGTYFDDGLVIKSELGDLIIHSGKIRHSGLPITKGTRYLLVGFMDLHLF